MTSRGRHTVALIGMFFTIMATVSMPGIVRAETVKSEIELTTKDVGSKETALGNLVADAVRAQAKTDLSFVAASSFNEVTLPKGNVTTADILRALEYKGDTISIVKLTGTQIRKALEHGLYLHPKFNSGFLHFSGMTVTYKPDAEKEKRVVSIKIGDDAIDNDKEYKVAMATPLANGALAYFKIWTKKEIDKETDKTLEEAVTAYMKDHKTITKGDERLVAKK